MEFNYKCPVCRARNKLTQTNQVCRRCKSNLASIYRIKKRAIFKTLKFILNREMG